MNQPCTEQTIRDNEQLAELEAMYEQTERALALIGDRMREIKNRLQKKPPVRDECISRDGEIFTYKDVSEATMHLTHVGSSFYTKLAGGKYEK